MTVCRQATQSVGGPSGSADNDAYDTGAWRWQPAEDIRLRTEGTLETCFRQLIDGEVDAVVANEFAGYRRLHAMGLDGQAGAHLQPLSIESLHAVISKTHHRGTTFLFRINDGIRRLRSQALYDRILDIHWSRFWRDLS